MRTRTLRSALAGGALAAAGAARQRDCAVATAGWLPQGGLAVLAAAVLVAMAAPAVAQAQAQAERVQFNIPAQPLVSALRAFAGQGKQQLLFDEDKLARFQAQALNGRYTPRQALDVLLAGTGVVVSQPGVGVFALKEPAAAAPAASTDATLSTVLVTAQAERAGTTEGTGSYTAAGASTTATGLGLTLRETPQTVSVLTRQQMDDFNMSTLQDIAKVMPGITLRGEAITDQETTFQARGFALEHINVDGLPLDVTGFNERNVSADLSMYDRVEVVRGATGLLEGAGSPSGSINLVRKRPTASPLLNLSAGVGSWAHQQLGIDASRALNEAGTVRGRVVGAWRDSDSFVGVTNTKNGTLYGILEVDLTPSTTLGVGAHVQRTRTDGVFGGLPTYSDGRHMNLPRSTYLGLSDSFQDRDNDVLFADLEHRFDNGWTLKAAATQVEATSDSRYTYGWRTDRETVFGAGNTGWGYGTEQRVLDVRAKGPVTLWGREHELMLGASYREDNATAASTWEGDEFEVDVTRWNGRIERLAGRSPASPLQWGRDTRETGVYAAGRFQLADPLHLILGGRFGWYTRNTTGWYTGEPTWKRSLHESAEFVPYVGLTYDLDSRHSVYGSVTEIYQPQSSIDANGNTLDPLTGTNYELGLKGAYFDGALNASAAVFRIRQRNRAVSDELNCPSGGAVACYRAAGEIESNGVDLQVSGTLSPGWQVSAGYTYVDATYTKDAIASNIGQRISTDEPRSLFRLYTNYRLRGAYSQWSINGSLQAQSRIYRSEAGYHTEQGRRAIVGAGVAYRVDDRWQLQLSVDNLLDKTYYNDLGYSWSGGGARYGAPRSFLLTARYAL